MNKQLEFYVETLTQHPDGWGLSGCADSCQEPTVIHNSGKSGHHKVFYLSSSRGACDAASTCWRDSENSEPCICSVLVRRCRWANTVSHRKKQICIASLKEINNTRMRGLCLCTSTVMWRCDCMSKTLLKWTKHPGTHTHYSGRKPEQADINCIAQIEHI